MMNKRERKRQEVKNHNDAYEYSKIEKAKCKAVKKKGISKKMAQYLAISSASSCVVNRP